MTYNIEIKVTLTLKVIECKFQPKKTRKFTVTLTFSSHCDSHILWPYNNTLLLFQMTDSEIVDQMMLLLLICQELPSSLMSTICQYVCLHPDLQDGILFEVRDVISQRYHLIEWIN